MADGPWRRADGNFLDGGEAYAVMGAARVLLLGERHDRAADHFWQAETICALAERMPVAVGFEMFPWTAEAPLADWSAGRLGFPKFLETIRWNEVWGHDPGLYRPLLEACRGPSLFGLNVARPVVKAIRHGGWEAAPPAEAEWLTPAAPATAAYRRYLFEMTGGARPDRAARAPEDPAFDGFVRAQQVWDRAFACRLALAARRAPGRLVIGVIGRGHLEYGHGVPAQLADLGLWGVVTALPGEGMPGEGPIADLVFEGDREDEGAGGS